MGNIFKNSFQKYFIESMGVIKAINLTIFYISYKSCVKIFLSLFISNCFKHHMLTWSYNNKDLLSCTLKKAFIRKQNKVLSSKRTKGSLSLRTIGFWILYNFVNKRIIDWIDASRTKYHSPILDPKLNIFSYKYL